MGTNRPHNAMYTFCIKYNLGVANARIVAVAFAQFTVQAFIDQSDKVINEALLNAGLDAYTTHRAMTSVRTERGLQFTPAGKLIEKQSNLSPEQIYAHDTFYKDHILYQALGIYRNATTEQVNSALHKQHALMAILLQQHKKEIQEMSQLYDRANKVFKNAVLKRVYDVKGDEY